LLGRALKEPLEARSLAAASEVMTAAVFAAQAFSSGSGLTIAHEFSDIAGFPLNLPHGYAAALLLPAVVDTGAGTGNGRLEALGRLFADIGWSGNAKKDVQAVLELLGAPALHRVASRETARSLMEQVYDVGDARHSIPREEALVLIDVALKAGRRE